MIKLTIYGRLRKFIGNSSFEIDVASPRQAFSFLVNNFKGVANHIKEQEYCVMAGDVRITEDLLDLQTQSDIKIIPMVQGEILFLALGAGFIGASLATAAKYAVLKGILLNIGISLTLSGVQELLFPAPDPFGSSRQDDPQDQSYSFTGLLNNSKQGVPINIVYGEMLVGSTVVSSSVDTFQVTDEDD